VNAAPQPSVSVIVPVHGDRGELRATLAALANQDYRGDVQVIVVDNGDNEGLPRSGGDVEVVTETQPGSYAARNAGVARARGEVLAFTDADCRPAADWLTRGMAVLLEAEPPAAVGGRIDVQLSPGKETGAALWDRLHGLRQDIYVQREGFAATANVLVTRAVFDANGPFDATLQSGGDREWGERAVRAGMRLLYEPDVVVHHPARSSLAELQRKALRLHRGAAALHLSRGQRTFSLGGLAYRLMPHCRSILRCARGLRAEGHGLEARIRYTVVALWLQYYSLSAWLRAAYELREH